MEVEDKGHAKVYFKSYILHSYHHYPCSRWRAPSHYLSNLEIKAMRNRQEMLQTLSKLTALREKPSNPAALPPNFPDKTSRKKWRHFSSSLLACNSWNKGCSIQSGDYLAQAFLQLQRNVPVLPQEKKIILGDSDTKAACVPLAQLRDAKLSTGSSAKAQNSVRNWVVRPRALRQLPCSDATSHRHIATLDL